LLSYPFAVEPFLRLRTQAWIWSALYAGFAALPVDGLAADSRGSGGCQLVSGRRGRPAAGIPGHPVLDGPRGGRIDAAGGDHNQASQGIAVIPFLWVAPLGSIC